MAQIFNINNNKHNHYQHNLILIAALLLEILMNQMLMSSEIMLFWIAKRALLISLLIKEVDKMVSPILMNININIHKMGM